MTPKEANTNENMCLLKRDNVSTKNSWFIVSSGQLSIANQRKGEKLTGKITLTKKEFEAFIRFYETGTSRKQSKK